MKILYINSVYGYGSTGKIVKKLKDEAEKNGDSASVVFGRKSAIGYKGEIPEEENCWYISSGAEQKADILSSVLFDTHGLHSRSVTKKIIDRIQKTDPDLIHLHNIHGFYINYPDLFSFLREYGKPVVWTMHDCWAFTGFCSHYMYNECDEWQRGCQNCRYRNVYPYRIFSSSARNYLRKMQAFGNQNMTIVTPSAWLRGELQKSFLKDYECCVIHNDADLDSFCYDPGTVRSSYGLEGKKIYLGCANIWTAQKGYEDCLKLAGKLDDNEVLVLIGLNDKQLRSLPDHMIGLGHCDADELKHWYSACDCFFNPTLEDTYPTVNLEAAACGAPVVTYNTGGSPEAAGNHGITVERDAVDDALAAMRAADRSQMPPVQKREKTMAQEYMELYRKILRGEE